MLLEGVRVWEVFLSGVRKNGEVWKIFCLGGMGVGENYDYLQFHLFLLLLIFFITYLFRLISNTINKKTINKFKIGWKLEEGKKPYHQAPTQLH